MGFGTWNIKSGRDKASRRPRGICVAEQMDYLCVGAPHLGEQYCVPADASCALETDNKPSLGILGAFWQGV